MMMFRTVPLSVCLILPTTIEKRKKKDRHFFEGRQDMLRVPRSGLNSVMLIFSFSPSSSVSPPSLLLLLLLLLFLFSHQHVHHRVYNASMCIFPRISLLYFSCHIPFSLARACAPFPFVSDSFVTMTRRNENRNRKVLLYHRYIYIYIYMNRFFSSSLVIVCVQKGKPDC
jgi:hypothetical protein